MSDKAVPFIQKADKEHVCLFIGGPCDGFRQAVPVDQESVQLVRLPVMDSSGLVKTGQGEVPEIVSAVYKRKSVRSENGVVTDVYVYGDVRIIEALLAGYRAADPNAVWR